MRLERTEGEISKHQRSFSDVINFTASNINIGDLLGISGRVDLGSLIDLNIDRFDFFFKIADKANVIQDTIQYVFSNWPDYLKARVDLASLIDIDASGFREAVVESIQEATGDRAISGGGLTRSTHYAG